MPQDPNCSGTATSPCPHYINNINHSRVVVGNGYIKQFQFNISAFETENNYDWFHYGPEGQSLTGLSGTAALGWYGILAPSSLQTTPGFFRFVTDASVTKQGIDIDQARVCCNTSQSSGTAYLKSFYRYEGVLLGTNDVVYFRTPTTGLGQHVTFALWGDANDWDLYVRCNSLPTATAWDYRSYGSTAHEFLEIPSGTCPVPGTWYVAVNSYSGAGQFHVVHHSHYSAQHRVLRAGTNFNATVANMSTFSATLRDAARHFFGATEGTVAIEKFDLYNSNNCSSCGGVACDVCFIDAAGTGNSPLCASGTINLNQGYWSDPEGVAHEFGHRFFCQSDEYYPAACASAPCTFQCGHSNMASPWGTQNNLCYPSDHKKDGTPGATVSSLLSAWTTANSAGVTPWVPSETPDNFDYRSFDFKSRVGTVVSH